MSSIKVYEVSGDIRPLNTISVWDASSSGTRPLNSIPVWKDTNEGDRPLNSIQVKIVDKALNAIPVWFNGGSEPGPGPEPLPPYTIRLKFKEGVTPTFKKGTGTLVDAENNIWDLTYENNYWGSLFENNSDLLEVIGGNTTGVTEMEHMLRNCTSLTNIGLFDTSTVTGMNYMLFLSTNVKSGALALYQQASTQTNPPTNHSSTFRYCGSNTQTGAAELAQIPTSWGGTMQE